MTEQETKAGATRLERSSEDLRHLTYVLSHDLQEPLRMVVTFVGLLAKKFEGQLDAESEKHLAFALNGSKRMQSLVNGLLGYLRAGTQVTHPVRTNLLDVITQAKYSLYQVIRESDASVMCDSMPEVNVDPVAMSSVFQNLMSNAIKFRKPGESPRIHISATLEENRWRIAIRDEGIGFDSKFAEKIFEPFNRLHSPGTYPGAGTGLAICRRIIENHMGSIWAESSDMNGSTFYISIPSIPEAGSLEPASLTQARVTVNNS